MKSSLSTWLLSAAACGVMVVVPACGASSGGDSDQGESAASAEESSEGAETASSGAQDGENSSKDGESGADSSDEAEAGELAEDESMSQDDPGAADSDTSQDGSGEDPGDSGGSGDDSAPPTDDAATDDGAEGDPADAEELDAAKDCTDSCPVPRLCVPCGDGCADAFVPCDAAGECGEVEWICEEEETPVKPGPTDLQCPALCPVPLLCQLCDDGSCASANPMCNDDGSCGEIEWLCDGEPAGTGDGPECRTVEQCPQIVAACRECPEGGMACPVMECIDGACVMTGNECEGEYDPCAGKDDGDSCSLCPPESLDCIETDEIKQCVDGKCTSAVIGVSL